MFRPILWFKTNYLWSTNFIMINGVMMKTRIVKKRTALVSKMTYSFVPYRRLLKLRRSDFDFNIQKKSRSRGRYRIIGTPLLWPYSNPGWLDSRFVGFSIKVEIIIALCNPIKTPIKPLHTRRNYIIGRNKLEQISSRKSLKPWSQ